MFVVVLSLFFTGTCLAAEPTCSCSPFEYEEKLLAKMIRQEFTFEKLKEDMMALQNKVIAKLEEIEREQETYKIEAKEARKELKHELTNWLDNDRKQLQHHTEEFQKLKEDFDDDAIAFFSKDISDISPSHGQIFIFTTIKINEGNGYDKLTGKFTAPLGGLYKFDVQLCLRGGSSNYVHFDILANNVKVQSGYLRDYDTFKCYTAYTLVRLEAGGKVWVVCDGCGENLLQTGDEWNTFSGVRIHA